MDVKSDFDDGQPIIRPPDTMTEELAADLHFCVTYLSPQQCRERLCGLSDEQIQSVVYDRVIRFPNDQWTTSIQEKYVVDMKVRNQKVTCFENIVESIRDVLQPWMGDSVFSPDQFKILERKLQTFILPSIDNIGVHATHSDYSQTKRNGLTALIDIGLLFLDTSIFSSTSIVLKYDGLSRAVANILHSAANRLQRQQMLDHGIEEGLKDLAERSKRTGIFSCLDKAMAPDPTPVPYHLPEMQPQQQYRTHPIQSQHLQPQLQQQQVQQKEQEMESGTKRKKAVTIPKPAKKAKTDSCNQLGHTVPSSTATMQADLPTTEQEVASQEEKEQRAITRIKDMIKQEQKHEAQEQDAPAQKTVETQQGQHPVAPAIQRTTQPVNFEDVIEDIGNQMFHAFVGKDERMQTLHAPSVCRRIEGWCSLIARRTKAVANAHQGGEPDILAKTQQNALWVLFWIIECCALDRMGTPLSREVSRQLGWAPIIHAVWSCVKDATPQEMQGLLRTVDNSGVTIEVKFDALLQSLRQTSVPGSERLNHVLEEMRHTASKTQ